MNWKTIEEEAYGIFKSVQLLAHLLHCKPFTICTDHNNLVWIASSLVPTIIRWRIYLQGFIAKIQHIPGKL